MDTTLATKPLTGTEIADIKGRHEAATGGLWTLDPDGCFGPGTVVTETGGYGSMIGALDFGHGKQADADTRFVLNAHSDMGALLAENERLRAAQPTIVRPSDSIDPDEWSIITNRRAIENAVRAWLGDIDPELLHHLTHGTTDIPGQIVDDLPGAVDELIDHIKRGVCTCDRFAGHHAPTCRTITG